MLREIGFGFLLAILLVSGLLLGDTACLQAQSDQLSTENELNKFTPYRLDFAKLYRGSVSPTAEEHKNTITLASKYYIYRVTIQNYRDQPGKLKEVRDEFSRIIKNIMLDVNVKRNENFRKVFSQELLKRFQYAFSKITLKDDPISYTNLVLMLPDAARLGQGEFGDFLLDLVKNSKEDVTKLFAFKALQNHFPQQLPDVQPFMEDEERLQRAAQLQPLLDFLKTSPANLNQATPRQRAAYQYIRNEAIKALAETRIPGIPLLPGLEGKMHAPVGHWLMVVAAGDKSGLSPPPTLTERVEAAIGLCRMRSKLVPSYQSKLGAYLVGHVVVDFVEEFKKDQDLFTQEISKTLPNGKSVTVRVPPRLPWRYYSARLYAALEDLEKNAPAELKGAKQFSNFLTSSKSTLMKIRDSSMSKRQVVFPTPPTRASLTGL